MGHKLTGFRRPSAVEAQDWILAFPASLPSAKLVMATSYGSKHAWELTPASRPSARFAPNGAILNFYNETNFQANTVPKPLMAQT